MKHDHHLVVDGSGEAHFKASLEDARAFAKACAFETVGTTINVYQYRECYTSKIVIDDDLPKASPACTCGGVP